MGVGVGVGVGVAAAMGKCFKLRRMVFTVCSPGSPDLPACRTSFWVDATTKARVSTRQFSGALPLLVRPACARVELISIAAQKGGDLRVHRSSSDP